jgi:hypothetical protein
MLPVLVSLMFAASAAEARTTEATGAFQLSTRVNRRYQDVIVTIDGSRWRGRLIARGDLYRIRLADQSELVIPKEQIVSVTRELNPGLVHSGQWCFRASPGFEAAFVIADEGGGPQYGGLLEVAIARNWGGSFEPELTVTLTPIGPQGSLTVEAGIGIRYYLQPDSKVKAYTNTQLILYGNRGDLGLRTGPGFMWDLSPGFGIGTNQGVTLLIQDNPAAVAVGYHAALTLQGRI